MMHRPIESTISNRNTNANACTSSKWVGRAFATICAAPMLLAVACSSGPSEGSRDVDFDSANADLQAEIDEFLEQNQSAEQISSHEVAWNEGRVVLDFVSADADLAQPDAAEASEWPGSGEIGSVKLALSKDQRHGCPSNAYCVYKDAGFKGKRLQFFDCPFLNELSIYNFQHDVTGFVNDKRRSVLFITDNGNDFTASPQSLSSNIGDPRNDHVKALHCL